MPDIVSENNSMSNDERLQPFVRCDALLQGHFVLSSGKHSTHYLQCAKLLQRAGLASKVIEVLAADVRASLGQDCSAIVVSPAMGGMLVGYEFSRHFGCINIFAERVDGEFALRRGFELEAGQNVIVVEDVVTTGGSVVEVIELVRSFAAVPIAVAALIDRSTSAVDFGVPFISYARLDLPLYSHDELPPSLLNIPVSKPGSRKIVSGS